MADPLAKRAGAALFWNGIQLGGGKAITLARTLVVARLLVPEDFGLFAISLIAVDFLMSVTNFGMIPALVQRIDAGERHYNTAWTVNLIRALAVAAAVFAAAPLIATAFGEPRATLLIRVVSLRPLLEGAASIRLAILTRELRFRSLTAVRLSEAAVNTAVSIALASAMGVWALIAGTIAGQMAYVVSSYVVAPHRPQLSLEPTVVRSLVRFGRWIFLTGLISVVVGSAVQAIISRQFGVAALGLYVLAAKLAFVPGEIATEVFGAVAFPLYARMQDDKRQVSRAFRSVLTAVMATLLPASALIAALAPSLVAAVLGPRWTGSEQLIRLLALASIVGLFGEAVVPLLKGIGVPHKIVVVEGAQSLLLIAFVFVLADRYGIAGAAAAWLPALAVSQVISAGLLARSLPRPFDGLGATVSVVTAASAAGVLVALGIDHLVPGLPGLLVGGLLAVTVIGALLWILDRRLSLSITSDLTRAFPQVAALQRLAFCFGHRSA